MMSKTTVLSPRAARAWHLAALAAAASTATLATSDAHARGKTAQSNAEQFHWNQDMSGVRMSSVDTHVCFLTGAWGQLATDGVVLVVHQSVNDIAQRIATGLLTGTNLDALPDTESDVWKLDGYGQGSDVGGTATCVPMAEFLVDPGVVPTHSDGNAWARVERPDGFSCSRKTATATLWNGNAASYLGGFSWSQFDASSSRITIVEGTPSTPSTLTLLRTRRSASSPGSAATSTAVATG